MRKSKLKKTHVSQLFTGALFTMEDGSNLECPSTDEWLKKFCYIYTMEYYSALKMNTFESVLKVDELRTYYTEWSESEKERYISYSIVYIQNLEKWYWRIYLQGSNGEVDIGNRLMDIGRAKRWWDVWKE